MGKLLPNYRKVLIEEIVDNIFSNSSQYYAFASHPIEYVGSVPDVANNDYETTFTNNWYMTFGKKLNSSDIVPVIQKNIWTTNTVYSRYDNTSNTIYANNNYYVVTEPSITGGSYYIYKCIDNANGGVSTVDPSTIGTPTQPSTFETDDGYKWRYITSISSLNYDKFASNDYAPVFTDPTISAAAPDYSGVDVVVISNGGNGYTSYTNGALVSFISNTVLEISSTASGSDNFYVNSGIYIYNSLETVSELKVINDYIVNSSGKYVVLNSSVDTNKINSNTVSNFNYLISPAIVFETDGDSDPIAYCTVNTSTYSIDGVIMLDSGSNISWANVIATSSYGSGANLYAIVPPPGGHGYDAPSELNAKGMAVAFNFANTESNTIPTSNTVYNKIGIIKNPSTLVANIATGTIQKGDTYSSNTFNNLLVANVSPSYTFTKGQVVIGSNSNSRGIVVFSNSSQVHLTCDQTFIDGEFLANTAGSNLTTIAIQTIPDVYTKDLKPIYVENINNINRSDSQSESYKLIVEI